MSGASSETEVMATLRPVLETALDAVVVMGSDGRIAAWNAVAERTFGWTAGEAVGQLMADIIVPPQHREAHCRGLARFQDTGEERVLNRRIEITAMHKDGRELPVELSITMAPSLHRMIFIGFLRDISDRHEAEARLLRQARETQLLFEVTRLAAETDSFDEALRSCLGAICQVTGWPVGHALILNGGRRGELVSTSVWVEAEPGSARALKEATAQMRFSRGTGLPGVILETAEPTWIADIDSHPNFPRKATGFQAAFGFPVGSEGRLIAVLEFFSKSAHEPDPDLMLIVRALGEQVGRVLERKRTEEHQRLLVNELNHRVKNTLAIVQSLASQSFKEGTVTAGALKAFESRVTALAAAHDLLTTEKWEAAPLRDLIDKAGLGCGASAERLTFAGPDVRLQPRTAVSVAMALHELCTNAVKYGALSNDDGVVTVAWDVDRSGEEPLLRLRWQEHGGPTVSPPERRGFGSRMIERGLAAELGGKVELLFLSEGVQFLLEAPLPAEEENGG